ncbi:uncharacterized protein PV07_02740 [Cladophialophora immunda]|uniref:Uncharacterized protein n=1 Tax=Cladophialophora immunda TaxID=569365 RepID=A0A0D2B0I1_9EURO|nr:uncharacterized protein PV07_02740 [Cladophialophora immunda]KIW31057.1 hypothetical protein PV07_02740 [Cladophialophora immunda]
MRLQILIQRHSLPPVTIIHTTGSGPASHTKSRAATVADLLADVNDLVPLESADGEWGLEDYVVEVAATADQHLTYECLHYQPLHNVLREDDEVVIRALSSEDLRIRRLGGRHQITGDGRHLIDGVAFGKQWLKKTARPGIVIPPRKRRRILFDEDADDTAGDDAKRILPVAAEEDNYMDALVPFANQEEEEDDDEDDGDYVDESDPDTDEARFQITIREEFDDADADSEGEVELNGGDEDEHLSSELKHLLEEAAEIEQAANMSIALQVLDRKLKRKRDVGDDGEEHENETFEGFSSPPHGSPAKVDGWPNSQEGGRAEWGDDGDESADSMMREIANRQAEKPARNVVEDDDDVDDSDDSDVISSSDVTSSDSDADSMMEDIAMQQAKKRALNLIRDDGDDVDDMSSSFDLQKDESDSDSSSTSESESDSVESSSSGSTTSTESESESESDSESDGEETKAEKAFISKATTSTAFPSTTVSQANPAPARPPKPSVGVPFQGTNRTRYNNDRAKKRKRLNELKKQGLLPENAGFDELAKYETIQQQEMAAQHTVLVEERADGPIQEDVQDVKAGEDTTAESNVNEVEKENESPSNDAEAAITNEAPAEPVSADLKALGTAQIEPAMAMESAPKRARLDVASTRRLVFGSLGLRAPKNAEERQALREKLSQNSRQPINQKGRGDGRTLESPQRLPAVENDDDSWKNKLIVAAVECEEPGKSLPPPPFPFEQGWAKPAKNKRKLRDQSQYYQSRHDQPREKGGASFEPNVSTLEYDDVSAQVSANEAVSTADGNSEVMPTWEDIDVLPELEQAMILPGATVAYKELHVDASTNYQPEVSQYRIGQVSHVDEDGTVHLHLTKSSMAADSKGKTDPQTGERVYGKFELTNEDADEGVDDGRREVSISDMISAKLVKPSVIQVPDSSHVSVPRGGEAPMLPSDDQFAVIPESADQNIQVKEAEKPSAAVQMIDTPRKEEINGIIKEAGFNSALDGELLEPIPSPATSEQAAPSPGDALTQSQGQYPHRFRPRSPNVDLAFPGVTTSSDVDAHATYHAGPNVTDATGSSQVSPTSSPHMPTQETVDYPHISQIDINSSEPTRTTNSSSHQDAQKCSLTPVLDLSSIASGQKQASIEGSVEKKSELDSNNLGNEHPGHPEDVPDSIKSEVSESQSQKTSIPSQNTEGDDEENADSGSFLGEVGYDGQDSSYHDSGISDDDSDLPSLIELVSNQNYRKKVSPPAPARKSLRNATKKTGRAALSSGPDLGDSSQTDIKQPQSQREPRLSQIPSGSPVVDLTFLSDQKSPIINMDDDSDPIYARKKTKSEINGLGWNTSTRTGKQDGGIGTRRLLTSKKVRD